MGFESGKDAILVKVKSGIRTFDKMLTMCIVHPVIKVNQTTSTRLAWKIMKLKVVFTLARASKVLPRREPLANLDLRPAVLSRAIAQDQIQLMDHRPIPDINAPRSSHP